MFFRALVQFFFYTVNIFFNFGSILSGERKMNEIIEKMNK